MNARDVGRVPHWVNRDNIGRFTPRLNSAPEMSLHPEPFKSVDDGRDPYSLEEYEAMQEESAEPKPFGGYARLSEVLPIRGS